MLPPVTHGCSQFTRIQILLYTVVLFAVSHLLPFAMRMSGWIYLIFSHGAGWSFSSAYASGAAAAALQRRPVAARPSATRFIISPRCSRHCSSTTTGSEASAARRCLPVAGVPGGRVRAEIAGVRGLGYHRRQLRPGLQTDRPHRQGADACRFSRQGRGDILRLHTMSGCVSDDALADLAGSDAVAGRRRGCRVQVLFVSPSIPNATRRRCSLFFRACVQSRRSRAWAVWRRRRDGRRGQGVQGAVSEAAGCNAGQLHDGPFGGNLRL